MQRQIGASRSLSHRSKVISKIRQNSRTSSFSPTVELGTSSSCNAVLQAERESAAIPMSSAASGSKLGFCQAKEALNAIDRWDLAVGIRRCA
jgi:hypothetical protein